MNERPLPTHRVTRFGKFASLAVKVAGNVVAEGSKRWVKGGRPQARDLVLTPKNINHLTDQLAHLRGAAMKLGQMLSMDAGDLIDPELAGILSRLRSNADPMAAKQFAKTMSEGLGGNWKSQFLAFNFKPVASASIGQVHHAYSDRGDELAVKVQYPGIKKSIDSDVDNVGTLLGLVGLIPKGVDYKGLLEEAKVQLHAEADYKRESVFATQFKQMLKDDPDFAVPTVFPECSSQTVLTMEYLHGNPIEDQEESDQETKDFVMTKLIGLLFREIFEFRLVQTDPNFANYLYLPETKQIGLLDFGATRTYDENISQGYRKVFSSVLGDDQDGLNKALEQIGFFSVGILHCQRQAILELVSMACEPMLVDGAYHFGQSGLAQRLREAGTVLSMDQDYWHTPPADALFLHRKIGGLYLLAARLNANVNVKALIDPFLT